MSFMEDEDDDFGDLYADVLRPFTTESSVTQPPLSISNSSNPPAELKSRQKDDDYILYGVSDPKLSIPSQTLVSNHGENRVEKEEATRVSPKLEVGEEATRVLESGAVELEPFISSEIGEVKFEESGNQDGVLIEKVDSFSGEVKTEGMELDDTEPLIPGLSSFSHPPLPFKPTGGFKDEDEDEDPNKVSKREDDDWDSDSDSEDDLKIVLNEEHDGVAGKENEDEDDLVIVAGDDQIHNNQLGVEQEFGEDGAKQIADGERKEIGEGAKAPNGLLMVTAVGARPIYNNQGFHPHHSQFKYVRPGAAVVPGGAIVGPGGVQSQVRPPVNIGPLAGANRGDWRPMGMKTASSMQKGFQPGFGFPGQFPGFGRGPEFTLPSHKTVFDIDIDSIEEKTWRHPGVDISDFFNFGLNEETWKDYCKQLGQLRLEATMQSKIRVYESGRSVQDYDPDLPPELAAAAGNQDTVENQTLGKTDGGKSDLTIQGRGAANARPLMPTGRAIQVEGGYGERLPSMETRQQRMRESDAVIEIVLQDSVDDDSFTDNGTHEQLQTELQGEDLKGDHRTEEDITEQLENDSFEHVLYNGTKEMVIRRDPFVGSVHNSNIHDGDGILPFPPEAAPIHYHPGSKGRIPVYPGGIFGAPHEGRRPQGTVSDRYSRLKAVDGIDVNPNLGAIRNRSCDTNKENSGKSSGGNQTPESSSQIQVDGARDSTAEQKDDLNNNLATADSSVKIDEDELGGDAILTSDTTGDGGPLHSGLKELNSRVGQPEIQDIDEGNDRRTINSGDNSKARSGSSRDYQGKYDGEEVVQEERARRMGDTRRRREENEKSFQKKGNADRNGRLEIERNPTDVKVREVPYHSHRDSYPNPAHQMRPKTTDFDMRRESSSAGARQRRNEDPHGRWVKDEESRKRERVEELESRHGIKARQSESNGRDEHHHSRKRLENSERRGRPEKVLGHSQRNRDDYLMSRHENLNDPPTKRRKDEDHLRREQVEKEEFLHGFKTREDTTRRKREADNFMEHRREDRSRLREKPDDPHFFRHRDESWRPRERDDWQRPKQPHEDILTNRDREESRGAVRSSRGTEDKLLMGNSRAKDESGVLGFEKDYPFKDKKRQTEQPKRREREEDSALPQHRGRENVCVIESYNEDRNPRHERSSKNNDVSVDNRQLSDKERPKRNLRSKESELGDQNTMARSKRKQEEPSAHRNVKVSTKYASEQETGNLLTSSPTRSCVPAQSSTLSSSSHSKKNHLEHEVPSQHNSMKNLGRDTSSDDERQNSRRRQSKQNSWMSEKERNYSTNTKIKEDNKKKNKNDPYSLACDQPNALPIKNVEAVHIQHQHPPGEDKTSGDSHGQDLSHLDTVAKLRKRSERFKLPLSSDKDATGNRKPDNEVITARSETAADAAEIKPERPARKRRWTDS